MPDTLSRARAHDDRDAAMHAARALDPSRRAYHRQTPASIPPDAGEGWGERFAAARPRLLRLARLNGVAPDAAEDVVQETLLEAWRALGALRDPARVDAWLDGVCRNVCHRYGRAAGTLAARQGPLPGALPGADATDDAADIPDPLAADPFDELDRGDMVALVDRALGHLRPDARAALVLRYLAELPAAEVAARLGVGVGALETRLSRARRELRVVLGGALRAEAAAFGLVPEPPAGEGAPWMREGARETRIWCPLCGGSRLLASIDRATGEVHYLCPGCEPFQRGRMAHIAGARNPALLDGVASPKPILSRLLALLTEHYARGLLAGGARCEDCGRVAQLVPRMPEEAPEEFLDLPGLHIRCPACGLVDVTEIGRLTLDLRATQRFWRAHPRIRLLPTREMEAAGRRAIAVSFEDMAGAGRHTVVWARETLDVLAVWGCGRRSGRRLRATARGRAGAIHRAPTMRGRTRASAGSPYTPPLPPDSAPSASSAVRNPDPCRMNRGLQKRTQAMLATLRNRNFALVWTAGLISMTGDWLLFIGLPIYVLTLTGSVLLTSVTLMAAFVPNLLFGSLAGVFVDRWNRKRTMVFANALQALAVLPLLLVASADQIWIVYAAAFAESTISLFFRPAESALLPLLVDEGRLASANALGGVNSNLARLVGPALGGLAIAAWGLGGVIWGDAASFVLAALLIGLIPARLARPVRAPEGADSDTAPAPRGGVLRELGEGLGVVRRERAVVVLFAMAALMGLGEGLFGVLLVVWTRRILAGGALELGWMMSAQAVGGLLGGLFVGGLIAPRVRPARLVGVCALLFGAIDLAIVDAPLYAPGHLPPSPIPAVATSLLLLVLGLFVLVGIPGIGMNAGATTLLQTVVPNTHLGRVMSLFFGLFALTTLGGMALAGFYGDQLGPLGPVLLLNGQGGVYMCAGLLAILFLWGLRPAPKASAEGAARPAEAASVTAG